MKEHWVSRGDVRLFVGELGEGRPVVLLHGGLANHQACLRFAAPLADRMRLVLPDLRGHGRSIHHGPLDWDVFADDVVAVLDDLGIDRALVGGSSFGAGCAVRTALRHPTRVEGLVLLAPAFGGDEHGLTSVQQAAMRAMAEAGRAARTVGMSVFHPLLETLPPEMREPARRLVDGYDPESIAAATVFMDSGAQPFVGPHELAAIRCPTLVVVNVDPTHPREVAAVFSRSIAHCTTVETADYAGAIAATFCTNASRSPPDSSAASGSSSPNRSITAKS